jgi:L-methionine (R)-S-oxide reductase
MDKVEAYKWAAKRIRAQVLRHIDLTATLANTSAILKEYFPNFFWVGFYHIKEDHLLLGPFQGPPACVKLQLGKGVCATCVAQKRTILVPNVHEFPGHIACDERSNSEIAVPVYDSTGAVRLVLDVDSEKLDDFDDEDVKGLGAIANLLKDIWYKS